MEFFGLERWLGDMFTMPFRPYGPNFFTFVIHRTAFVVVFLQHRMSVYTQRAPEGEYEVSRLSQLFLT